MSQSCHNTGLCRLLSVLGVIGAILSARADYLPTHGPVPFVFQPIPKTPKPAILIVKAEEAKAEAETPHPPQSLPERTELKVGITEPSPAEAESVLAKSPEPYIVTAASFSPPPVQSPAAETLTPQMMLQFFESSGGQSKKPETTVAGTISFAPPRPEAKLPSKATSATP